MPNILDGNGLQTKTYEELLAELTAAYKSIYGADINLDQDTPDGQMMNIYIEQILDQSDLLTEVYNSFSPDNAIGITLDQRVAYNGIQRQGGTYTTTEIEIVTSQSVTLYGLDQSSEPVYTVSDSSGNEWQLVDTESVVGAATTSMLFQAFNPGASLTVPNTITTTVTIVLGVTSVNNPTTYTTLGLDEESDAALKIRRSKSVSLSSQGYLSSLLAALLNVNGVSDAFVHENTSSVVDSDGVPSHSIWVIVSGSGADADIANAIYTKRNAGAGMFGLISYDVTQVDGSIFTVLWDIVESEDVFIKFTATSLDGVNDPDYDAILSGLPTNFVPGVNEKININDLSTEIQNIDNNTLVTQEGFSDLAGGVYTDTYSPTTKKNQLLISEAKIIILPILLYPKTSSVGGSEEIQFTAVGGNDADIWDLLQDESGASVSISGLYTSGVGTGVDIVRVTDALGNVATATITVV